MTLADPFYRSGDHVAVELPGARAIFTTRLGGVSRGPYATLNLGRLTDDDPADVERNRELLQEFLGVRLAFARQVHGARVLRTAEPRDERTRLPEADGQATSARGVAPMVTTADCMPVALAGGGAVAMLHAGWRGLASGVIAEGVRALRELGGGNEELVAAVGPAARACCYEVGEEVHREFADVPGARQGRHLDMPLVARHQLANAGISEIHDCGLCTICSVDPPFFSHRRDRGVTGRQAGVAWLT